MSDTTRRWIRTVLQALVVAAALLPGLVNQLGLSAYGWAAGAVAACGAVSRLMAIPAVDQLLARLGIGADSGGGR